MNNNNTIHTFNLFVEIYLKCKCVSDKLSNYLVFFNRFTHCKIVYNNFNSCI